MSTPSPVISNSSKKETSKKHEIKPPARQKASIGEHASPAAIFQQARDDPRTLTPRNVLQLQRTIGNQAVGQLLTQTSGQQSIQKKKNNTGLPDDLKDGIENLSGAAMDDVRVHYNSTKPSELQALAYTQGTDIYVASGQKRHLPHEAWHAVQQKQGRVKPTMQMRDGIQVNDDTGLEHEADVMGARSAGTRPDPDNLQAALDNGPRQSTLWAHPPKLLKPVVVQKRKDQYIPDVREPHVHVHSGGVTFTTVGHHHRTLADGDVARRGVINEVLQDLKAQMDARSQLIADWIQKKFLVPFS